VPFAHTSDGVAIHYEVHGHGRPLVLISGQSNSLHWWDRVREDFAARFTTIVLDHRGTGKSDKPDLAVGSDVYSTRRFAADVVSVLDDLAIERAHVYGASMGGRVAQWIAADHAERVDRLVLGCTSPGARHGVERSDEVRRLLARPDPYAVRAALLDLFYTPAWLAREPGPYYTLGDPSMTADSRRGHLRASARHDSWDALPSIGAPTLVVHGEDDVFNPAANAPLLAGRIPGAVLHTIPGARHGYFEEFRDEASPLVLDFLDAG
jgi:pimeloyl-ACP methyl ester carboxylesterase